MPWLEREKGVERDLKLNSRPKQYRKWTKEWMAGAIKHVMDGEMGINRAAYQYGVHVLRTTLKDTLSVRVTLGSNPRPVPYLTCEEEDEVVKHLLTYADIGYPKTKQEVLTLST